MTIYLVVENIDLGYHVHRAFYDEEPACRIALELQKKSENLYGTNKTYYEVIEQEVEDWVDEYVV